MPLRFVKMHGLGNDFLVVDRRPEGRPPAPEAAVRLCDRHRGVGGDGVLSVLPSPRAAIAMHVTNSDGSIAEMCGNGLRCVVRWAVDEGVLPADGGPVDTGRGVLDCRVEPDGNVRIDMGRPMLVPAEIPLVASGDRFLDTPLDPGGRAFSAVSMGNPHAVTFVEPGPDLEALARAEGPALERHPRFPKRTNVEFARFSGKDALDLVVWERGAGLTQACGTGACATAVAAVLTGRAESGRILTVRLPGGPLRIEVAPDLSRVFMSGPAVAVFEGSVHD